MESLDHNQRAKTQQFELDKFFDAAAHVVAGLAETVRTASSRVRQSEFNRAERVLAALPLGTEEFQIAQRRLQNGWHYNVAGEMGAAAFELRQISKRLTR